MSSRWDQPGHILAFERLGSREESRFMGCSPSRSSQPGLPPPAAPQGGAQLWADGVLLGAWRGSLCPLCCRGQACVGEPPRLGPQLLRQCPGGCCLRPKAGEPSLSTVPAHSQPSSRGLCEHGVEGSRTGATGLYQCHCHRRHWNAHGQPAVPRPALSLQLCHSTV